MTQDDELPPETGVDYLTQSIQTLSDIIHLCQQNNELLTGPDEWTRCIVILKGKYFIFQLQDEPKSIADQHSMVNFDYNSSLKGKFICFLLDQTCKVHINEKYENSFIFRAVSKSYIFEDYSSLMNMISFSTSSNSMILCFFSIKILFFSKNLTAILTFCWQLLNQLQ